MTWHARAAAMRDRQRALQRLSKFLLRRGRRPATKMKHGTAAYLAWARRCAFEHATHREVVAIAWKAQQCLTRRDRTLVAPGKPSSKAVMAIARELDHGGGRETRMRRRTTGRLGSGSSAGAGNSARPGDQPGGQESRRPPITCTWR